MFELLPPAGWLAVVTVEGASALTGFVVPTIGATKAVAMAGTMRRYAAAVSDRCKGCGRTRRLPRTGGGRTESKGRENGTTLDDRCNTWCKSLDKVRLADWLLATPATWHTLCLINGEYV